MATEVGEVVIRFTGDTGQLDRTFNRVESETRGFARSFGSNMQRAGGAVTRFGLGVTALTAPLTAAFTFAVNQSMNFESAFANVKKTVDGTDEELNNLRDTIRDMATNPENPLSALENAHVVLADIMAIGGQLGVNVDSLDEFTQTVGLLTVATNLSAESAGFLVGRFQALTGLETENFDNFADALVTLGNNMPVTEEQIASMALEFAAIGDQMGLSEDQILAFAATMASLNIAPDKARSAFTFFFNSVTEAIATGGAELQTFADVADMSADEFVNAWETDPANAIQSFLEGLSGLSDVEQLRVLEQLGLDGQLTADVFRRMSGNTELLASALSMSGEAFRGNNAAMDEGTAKADTLEGAWNRLKNQMNDAAITIGDSLNPGLRDLANDMTPVVEGFNEWANENPQLISTLALIAGGLTLLGIVGLGLGAVISGLGTVFTVLAAVIGPVIGLGSALIATVFSPLGLVIGGVVALIIGGAGLIFGFQNMIDKIEELTGLDLSFLDGIAGKFDSIRNAIGDAANAVGDFISRINGGAGEGFLFDPSTPSVGQQLAEGTLPFQVLNQATGGPVTSGKASIVGETGRELFIPQTNGFMVNAHNLRQWSQSGSGGGGDQIIISGPINVYGVQDVEGLYTELEKVGQRRTRGSSRMAVNI